MLSFISKLTQAMKLLNDDLHECLGCRKAVEDKVAQPQTLSARIIHQCHNRDRRIDTVKDCG